VSQNLESAKGRIDLVGETVSPGKRSGNVLTNGSGSVLIVVQRFPSRSGQRAAGCDVGTKTSMNSRLHRIQNWPELARQAQWSAALLAKQCKVSARTLERYFHEKMGVCPHAWLFEQRQRQAVELLRDGSSVKETAIILGYKSATHFSRDFKKHFGHSPSTQPNTFEV